MRRDGGLDILFNYNILAVEGHPLGVRSDTSQPSKTMKKDGRGQKYLNGKERAPQTQERREEVSKSSSSAVVPGKGVSRHDTSATPAPSERRFPSTPASPIVFLDFSPNQKRNSSKTNSSIRIVIIILRQRGAALTVVKLA